MNARLAEVTRENRVSGDLLRGVDAIFQRYGREITRRHVPRAVAEGRRLAARFGVSEDAAGMALWLHDIGGVFARSEMVGLCEALDVPVCPEERQLPLVLHAKLNVVLAREWQGVTSPDILQAVLYHTTLHAEPTPLDQVVFLADKLEWDQRGLPPYHAGLSAALDEGVDAGTRWMLAWMAQPQAKLLISHPDLCAAWTHYDIQPVL